MTSKLKEGSIVKSPISSGVLTENRGYKVLGVVKITGIFGAMFKIQDDNGGIRTCLEKECSHLGDKNWIVVTSNKKQ